MTTASTPVSSQGDSERKTSSKQPPAAVPPARIRRWSRSADQEKQKRPKTKFTMWGEQTIALREVSGPSPTDILIRARALQAARAIHRGYKPTSKQFEALSRLATKPSAPRWAKKAFESFTGGLENGARAVPQ